MKKAVTLIELVMVMVIVGILASVTIPKLIHTKVLGVITKTESELSVLKIAVENYYLYHDRTYPLALSNLTAAVPQVVSSIPKDPFANDGRSYGYSLSGNRNYYVIYSAGLEHNGSASVDDFGQIAEINAASCIYVSNAEEDSQP